MLPRQQEFIFVLVVTKVEWESIFSISDLGVGAKMRYGNLKFFFSLIYGNHLLVLSLLIAHPIVYVF
jgi:hypothetical protein